MKRLPRRATRRGRTGKLGRKAKGRETSKGTEARPADKVSLDFLMLRNVHDHLAIDKLRSTPVGALAVDRLVRNDPQMVPLMREALVEVSVGVYAWTSHGSCMRSKQLSSLSPKSRIMPASVVSDFERWSKLSHPGG
jgi:hypothetical protein